MTLHQLIERREQMIAKSRDAQRERKRKRLAELNAKTTALTTALLRRSKRSAA